MFELEGYLGDFIFKHLYYMYNFDHFEHIEHFTKQVVGFLFLVCFEQKEHFCS